MYDDAISIVPRYWSSKLQDLRVVPRLTSKLRMCSRALAESSDHEEEIVQQNVFVCGDGPLGGCARTICIRVLHSDYGGHPVRSWMLYDHDVAAGFIVARRWRGRDPADFIGRAWLDEISPCSQNGLFPLSEICIKPGCSVSVVMWPVPAMIHEPNRHNNRCLLLFPGKGAELPRQL